MRSLISSSCTQVGHAATCARWAAHKTANTQSTIPTRPNPHAMLTAPTRSWMPALLRCFGQSALQVHQSARLGFSRRRSGRLWLALGVVDSVQTCKRVQTSRSSFLINATRTPVQQIPHKEGTRKQGGHTGQEQAFPTSNAHRQPTCPPWQIGSRTS